MRNTFILLTASLRCCSSTLHARSLQDLMKAAGQKEKVTVEEDYTYHGGDHLVMKVLELKPGPVDPQVFEVTKESWK